MKTRSNGLVLSISSTFGLGIIAGLRIHLAGTTYFSPLLSANLLTPWYAGYTPGMADEILIGFNFFDFFDFWGSAETIALVMGFSTCNTEDIVALVLRCILVLRCDSTSVLTALGRDPECWQCPSQKASLSQLMSKITPCFCIYDLLRINECWFSFVTRKGASNLVWPCTISVG